MTFELRCFDEDVGVNDLIGVAYVTMNKFIHHPNDKHVLEVRKRERYNNIIDRKKKRVYIIMTGFFT